MTLAIYADLAYRRDGSALFAEESFALFAARLAEFTDGVTLVGRLDPQPGRFPHRLPDGVELCPLPWYPALSRPFSAAGSLAASLATFARLLGRVESVWLLGPHPLALVFALMAALRRRRVVLGVRQDFPRYVRARHPDGPALLAAALVLDAAWRCLARRFRVVTVGPELARRYARARRVTTILVSLVEEEDVAAPAGGARSYDGELRLLSVGRLDPEKNPLLVADVLAALLRRDGRWRLVVCGDGSLRSALGQRLEALGVADRAELRGHVPLNGELRDLYRDSHALLHTSWTEGVPQVLLEAFAAGLPVVATAVGGVPALARGAALLVPPGDPGAATEALSRMASDGALRRRLTETGLERAHAHTAEAECARLAAFIDGYARPRIRRSKR